MNQPAIYNPNFPALYAIEVLLHKAVTDAAARGFRYAVQEMVATPEVRQICIFEVDAEGNPNLEGRNVWVGEYTKASGSTVVIEGSSGQAQKEIGLQFGIPKGMVFNYVPVIDKLAAFLLKRFKEENDPPKLETPVEQKEDFGSRVCAALTAKGDTAFAPDERLYFSISGLLGGGVLTFTVKKGAIGSGGESLNFLHMEVMEMKNGMIRTVFYKASPLDQLVRLEEYCFDYPADQFETFIQEGFHFLYHGIVPEPKVEITPGSTFGVGKEYEPQMAAECPKILAFTRVFNNIMQEEYPNVKWHWDAPGLDSRRQVVFIFRANEQGERIENSQYVELSEVPPGSQPARELEGILTLVGYDISQPVTSPNRFVPSNITNILPEPENWHGLDALAKHVAIFLTNAPEETVATNNKDEKVASDPVISISPWSLVHRFLTEEEKLNPHMAHKRFVSTVDSTHCQIHLALVTDATSTPVNPRKVNMVYSDEMRASLGIDFYKKAMNSTIEHHIGHYTRNDVMTMATDITNYLALGRIPENSHVFIKPIHNQDPIVTTEKIEMPAPDAPALPSIGEALYNRLLQATDEAHFDSGIILAQQDSVRSEYENVLYDRYLMLRYKENGHRVNGNSIHLLAYTKTGEGGKGYVIIAFEKDGGEREEVGVYDKENIDSAVQLIITHLKGESKPGESAVSTFVNDVDAFLVGKMTAAAEPFDSADALVHVTLHALNAVDGEIQRRFYVMDPVTGVRINDYHVDNTITPGEGMEFEFYNGLHYVKERHQFPFGTEIPQDIFVNAMMHLLQASNKQEEHAPTAKEKQRDAAQAIAVKMVGAQIRCLEDEIDKLKKLKELIRDGVLEFEVEAVHRLSSHTTSVQVMVVAHPNQEYMDLATRTFEIHMPIRPADDFIIS
jgi:hypothetical protein